jgi:hypothetical protein
VAERHTKIRQLVGWYRLPRSGRLFHGTVPPGAVEVAESDAVAELGQQHVDPSEGGVTVGADVFVDQQGPQPLELADTPPSAASDTGEGGGDVEGAVVGIDDGVDPDLEVAHGPGE